MSVVLAVCVAVAVAFLEHARAISYLTPRFETASDSDSSTQPFSYKPGRFMQNLEWSSYDLRFRWRGARKPSPDILIIAVDEKSLDAFHAWPWPRSIHARLIDLLKKNPPKALLFDIFFIDPFTSDATGDRALVRATAAAPWVVHSLFLKVKGHSVYGGETPFPALAAATREVGSVNAIADEDGVLRSALLEMPAGELRVPLLSVVGAGLAQGIDTARAARGVPTDSRGEMRVDFAGPAFTYSYLSYADVLEGRISPDTFAGKIVLVGASATGTYDHYPTPLAAAMPGVEFHANVIDNLVNHRELRSLDMRWTYLTIGLFALFCGLVLAALSARAGAFWALVAFVVYVTASQWLFTYRLLMMDSAGPLLTLVGGYVAVVIYRFFTEEREKRWVKAAFGQYVSPKVLDILMDDPGTLKLVGERKEITAFFSDVAGFTSISERLNPDELVVLLNKYLSAMTEVIFRYDGYLNKYMGDGIMAFWNAPLRQSDHAERACLCALESQRCLENLNKELAEEGLVPLKARIGINTGVMVVGNMGSVQKSDYTVMGDHVNIASRLEGANKAFGTSIMISEFTYEIIQDKFEVRYLDRARVPGKAKPVKTYELLSEKGDLGVAWTNALPLYHEAIQLFADRQFSLSRAKFLEVLPILGHDKVCEAYLERAELYVTHPPAKEWDGVLEIKSK